MFITRWHCLLSLHFYVPINSTRGCSVRLHSSHKEQAGGAPCSRVGDPSLRTRQLRSQG